MLFRSLERVLVWAWLAAYGGMMLVLLSGIQLHDWFEFNEPGYDLAAETAVVAAFAVLYCSPLLRLWPWWSRALWFLTLACLVFVAMVVMLAVALMAVLFPIATVSTSFY